MHLDTLQLRNQLPLIPQTSGDQEIVLRRLESHSDIGAVHRLREEIDLSVHAQLNPSFYSDEKKEMTLACQSHSSRTVN
ncbi:hypothetical protein OKW50_007495 [Paraburkholderia youngii]|uniref:Uncharacterized protein n=1 Tax=Paraburkholderia youngii TaxID=2782701 RepID=A0A7W8L7Q2_9BURK|nr:hypothetical protein [Paraburkholderia youngii]MBB5402050.1 hypothetical protein [Paraburkholderia youngii]